VAARCRQLGLSPVFLTDHDTIAGAARLQAIGRERVVIGEEVMTNAGELIGLFLERPIQRGLTPLETAFEIKAQGGLVYLEHPYDPFRRHLSEENIESIAHLIDIVEIFNGRSEEQANHRAQDLCDILDATPGAGSDAHSLKEIGFGYVDMDDFDGAQDFLVKLRGAKIGHHRRAFRLTAMAQLQNKIRRQ
jgi:predicted metal-dependent phosphoesterase TrpH